MYKKQRICLLIFMLSFVLVTACSKGGKGKGKDADDAGGEEQLTTEEPSDRVIVTLGDSYASGEGIEPFYGQLSKDLAETGDYFGKFEGMFDKEDKSPVSEKVQNDDWLAHRSQYAWSGMLTLPGVEGNMAENRGTHWYFAAASGAATHNIIGYDIDENGNKNYEKYIDHITGEEKDCRQLKETKQDGEKNKVNLEPQIKIFDELKAEGKKADYVIISIGGNDVGFNYVVNQVMIGSWYLDMSNLDDMIDDAAALVKEGGAVREDLKRTYREVAEAAGPQATLIIVGYPELFDRHGGGILVAEDEARIVDDGVNLFNKEIQSIVEECRKEGMKIECVSVEEAFGTVDEDGNIIDPQHQAYADDDYIENIVFGAKDEELISDSTFSSYSMHPNLKGSMAYAECVQKKINELEEAKGRFGDGLNPKYKEAYLEVLEQNKKAIEAYDRQFKDGSTAKPVALYDICGKGVPELMFITAGESDAQGAAAEDLEKQSAADGRSGGAVLHIYTYSDDKAVEIYSCEIDPLTTGADGDQDKDSSASGYLLFSTKFTRELYLLCGSSEPGEKASYKRLSLEGDKLVEKPFISYEVTEEKKEGSDDKEGKDSKLTTTYKYRDDDISKKNYGKVEKKLLLAAKDVILCDDEYSEYMTKGDSFNPSGDVSMTYDKAVLKLK